LDRLVAFDGVDYAYDGLGRVSSRGADSFAYSGFGLDPSSDGVQTFGRSPGGGAYNQAYLDKWATLRGRAPTVSDVLEWRAEITKVFDIDQYRPH